MKRLTLLLLLVAGLTSGRANGTWSQFQTVKTDTAGYVTPKDTTVYFPPVDTTHYEPVDTGEVVRPDVPSKPVIYVPTIREEDNVTEYPHNPAVDDMLSSVKPAKQEFTMTIEGVAQTPKTSKVEIDHDKVDFGIGAENWQPLTTGETKTTEFSVSGTKWYANSYYSDRWGASTNTTVCYSLGGDTLIDKNIWKKLYKETTLLGYLRETDGRVWVYPENIGDLYPYKKGEPFILYDFTLQKGDTIYLNLWTIGITSTPNPDYDNWEYVVKEVRFEHDRKIIDFGHEQWIEGVGSNSSAFFDLWKARPTNGSSSWEAVYQTVSNGKTFYFNGEVADPNATPWLQEGMVWTQNWNYNDNSDGKFRQIALTEEIRSGTFVLGWHSSWSGDYIFEYMQDFNGKVYAMQNGRIELCYDFTVQKGDTITLLSYWYEDPISYHKIIQYDTCTVSKVDSVEYDGIIRKRIILTGNREDVWMEGIGSLTRALPIDGMMPFATCKWDSSRITCLCKDEETLFLHPDFIDCTTSKASGIEYKNVTDEVYIQFTASTLLCTAPDAVKLEVYTMDAVKVGEARFQGGEAKVKVSNAPAMYLYIVTYPDGRRESGKARVN